MKDIKELAERIAKDFSSPHGRRTGREHDMNEKWPFNDYAEQPQELLWLYTHCCAIGMKHKSDSGKLEHDIALFTAELCALLTQAEEALNLWKRARDNSEESELDDMACYCVPMPLFCDAEESMDEALAASKQWKEQT